MTLTCTSAHYLHETINASSMPYQCCCASISSTSRPRQNGCQFAQDIIKRIFVNYNSCFSVKIQLKCVPKRPVENKSAMIHVLVCRQAASHYLNQWRISVSLGIKELTHIRHVMQICFKRQMSSVKRFSRVQHKPIRPTLTNDDLSIWPKVSES